jgi:hypothetical protein
LRLPIVDGGTEGAAAWMDACARFVEQFTAWKVEEGLDVELDIRPC